MANGIGQQLGNYRLIRLLGRGGFAEVYLGEHIYLNTAVAIKVLHTQLASDDMDDFLKEARTIARLKDPNIVRVLEFGIEDKTPFLAMEYASHGTLRQRHPKGSQLQLATIISYVKPIAGALQHAHDEKLIHRDIKPENMLLGDRDEVLLSDFGIAMAAESSRFQNTQEVVGTVAYMSPEQISGKPRPASDQYSLAVVVYEWLSGNRPFQGSFTELCTQHMYASPPPLREKLPTIAPEVEQVVSKALAKDPHLRFMSIQTFANALEESYQLQQETFVKLYPPRSSSQLIPPSPRSGPGRTTEPQISSGPGPLEMAAEEKTNMWGIGRRQLAAMVVGTILFAALFFLSDSFGFISFVNIAAIALAWGVLLFVGTAFGPWAGLFVGGGGQLIVGIFQEQLIANIFFWK